MTLILYGDALVLSFVQTARRLGRLGPGPSGQLEQGPLAAEVLTAEPIFEHQVESQAENLTVGVRTSDSFHLPPEHQHSSS
jgi:hypothetical protein